MSALKGNGGVRSSCFASAIIREASFTLHWFQRGANHIRPKMLQINMHNNVSKVPHFRCVSNRMCVERPPSKRHQSSELPSEPSLTFASAIFSVMKQFSAACFWIDCSSKVDWTAWNPRTWHSLQQKTKASNGHFYWIFHMNKVNILLVNNFLSLLTKIKHCQNPISWCDEQVVKFITDKSSLRIYVQEQLS